MNEAQEKALREAVSRAVEQGDDLRDQVYALTLEALREGHLDKERVRAVVRAVTEGVSEAAERTGRPVNEALREAVAGMDAALVKAAEAVKLALEEAASHLEEFSQQDLRRALDELDSVENVMLDTLSEVGTKAGATVRTVIEDLVRHARHSGTAVGQYVAGVREAIGNGLRQALHEGVDAARVAARSLAALAAGFFAGIADGLAKGPEKGVAEGAPSAAEPAPAPQQESAPGEASAAEQPRHGESRP